MCRRTWRLAPVALTALLGSACATMGTGTGKTGGGGPGVRFDWKARNAETGHISATFADGRSYTGSLYQITSETEVDELAPLWVGWPAGWFGWPYWDGSPEFVTHYSGRVVANLTGPDGDHMRCNFRLVRPDKGMAGGGEGRCQLSDGGTIDASFPSA
jgi:hypothetical protein